ncbi:MAG: electron transport complex subunit E [bacterium]|nr:electron transport complex subunit E [bacterium]
MSIAKDFKKGIIQENPIFRMLLGLCPTLAVTTSVLNGLAMGAATMTVLVCANLAVSTLRELIPAKVRIPTFIVIIATFVTIVDLGIAAIDYKLYKALGIFIPLIVVNCVILGRAEAFASKHPLLPSLADGLGMGLGITLSLTVVGAVREILGNGTLLGLSLFGAGYQPVLVMILPPGAFLALGCLLALINRLTGETS